jgi:hypothetical protein
MDEGRDHMEIWLGAECYASEYQARDVRSDARSETTKTKPEAMSSLLLEVSVPRR